MRGLATTFRVPNAGPVAVAQPAPAPRRNGQPAPRRGDGPAFGTAAVRGDDAAVCRRRDLRKNRRERARAGRLHHPAHESAGGKLHGAAAPDGRGAARERGPHHGGASVFRLRAAGPERSAARGDQRQADCESDHARRRGSRAGNGFSFPPGPGILRYPGGPSVRGAGVREPLPDEAAARSGRRRAGRGLGEDGPRVREAARRVARDHRQAAPVREHRGSRERRR